MSIFSVERQRLAEAEAARQEKEAKEAERQAKLDGVEFEGVMCSVHKEDQWGLDSIATKVRAGQPIPFHFKNGNVLVLTPQNIDAFEQVWVAYRMSFFQPANPL